MSIPQVAADMKLCAAGGLRQLVAQSKTSQRQDPTVVYE